MDRVCEQTTRFEGARGSARLLVIHLCSCAAAAGAAALFFALGLRFHECAVHRLCGLYCLTCGATRAARVLLQGRVLLSVLLNPLPVMLGIFMLTVLGFESAGVIAKRRFRFRWLTTAIYIMLGVLVVFCVLRNFGIIPIPDSLY